MTEWIISLKLSPSKKMTYPSSVLHSRQSLGTVGAVRRVSINKQALEEAELRLEYINITVLNVKHILKKKQLVDKHNRLIRILNNSEIQFAPPPITTNYMMMIWPKVSKCYMLVESLHVEQRSFIVSSVTHFYHGGWSHHSITNQDFSF